MTIHETYIAFDSKGDPSGKYNLDIKTTPKQILSFEIIQAMLPVLPVKYLCLKIDKLDNVISLNDNNKSVDNAFALFHFNHNKDNDEKYFNKDNIYPNKIVFNNPLSSLNNIKLSWIDNNNNNVRFIKPKYNINDTVHYVLDNSRYFGIIIDVNIHDIIQYTIQDISSRNIHNIDEKYIVRFNVNDNVFVTKDSGFKPGVILNDNEVYVHNDGSVINYDEDILYPKIDFIEGYNQYWYFNSPDWVYGTVTTTEDQGVYTIDVLQYSSNSRFNSNSLHPFVHVYPKYSIPEVKDHSFICKITHLQS